MTEDQSIFLVFILKTFAIYSSTVVVTESYAFQTFRQLFEKALQKIRLTKFTNQGEYSFIECNLCVGFWMTLLWILAPIPTPALIIAAVYGALICIQNSEKY